MVWRDGGEKVGGITAAYLWVLATKQAQTSGVNFQDSCLEREDGEGSNEGKVDEKSSNECGAGV